MCEVGQLQMVLYTTSLGGDEVTGVTEWAMNHLTVTGWRVTFSQIDGTAGAEKCWVFFLEKKYIMPNI